MQISLFAITAVFILACAPSEQQMVRRQSGTIDISKHGALARRLFPDINKRQGIEEDCIDDTQEPVQKQPEQTPPNKDKTLPAYTTPQKQQPQPSKQHSNTSTVPVNVPATLAFGKTFHGDATFYGSAGGGGACGFGNFKATLPGIAIGAHIFGQGEACGSCVRLDPGSHGNPVVVQVDNKCPECGDGTDCESTSVRRRSMADPI
jgi:hypothetical protein